MFDSCHNGIDKHKQDVGEPVTLGSEAESKTECDSAVSHTQDALKLSELDAAPDFETILREAYDLIFVRLEAASGVPDMREVELFCALEDAAKALMRVLEIDEEAQFYE
jgi:hypothetical protein